MLGVVMMLLPLRGHCVIFCRPFALAKGLKCVHPIENGLAGCVPHLVGMLGGEERPKYYHHPMTRYA